MESCLLLVSLGDSLMRRVCRPGQCPLSAAGSPLQNKRQDEKHRYSIQLAAAYRLFTQSVLIFHHQTHRVTLYIIVDWIRHVWMLGSLSSLEVYKLQQTDHHRWHKGLGSPCRCCPHWTWIGSRACVSGRWRRLVARTSDTSHRWWWRWAGLREEEEGAKCNWQTDGPTKSLESAEIILDKY